jgi:hypothetical protein
VTGKEWKETHTEMFEEGATILCIENTYIPARNGTTRVVERSGPTVCDCRDEDGKPYRMEMPKRVTQVERLEGGAIRYPIGRDAHTVTLKRVA